MVKCRVGYHFYKHKSWRHRLLRILTVSNVGHVDISVQTPSGISYYDCTWPKLSGWYTEDRPFVPFDSYYEDTELSLTTLDLVLPVGEKYSLWKVGLHYLTGYPKYPSSCVSSVHRIRYLMGKETKGRSPGGLYKYIRRHLCDSEGTTRTTH